MKATYLIRNNNNRLLLIWAGWGMDTCPFEALSRTLKGYDCCICHDYTDPHLPADAFKEYQEIELYGWSFGVFMAATTLHGRQLPIVRATAINGTPYGVDYTKGIAPDIFAATLQHLDEKSYHKFCRRMCGDSNTLQHFLQVIPQRDTDSLRAELSAIGTHIEQTGRKPFRWTRAIVGLNDRIFPAEAQFRAWDEQQVPTITIDMAHYTDFPQLIGQDLIDKQRIAQRFTRAIGDYDDQAIVQRQMATRLASLLPADFTAENILEIGCGTGLLTHLLAQRMPHAALTLNDLCEAMRQPAERAAGRPATFLAGDAEQLVPAETYSLIASAATLQWISNLPRFIARMEAALKANGMLLFSTFGTDNLMEMRQITGKGLAYFSCETLRQMFRQHFANVSVTEEKQTLTFDSPMEVLRHLQQTGANGLPASPFSLRKFAEEYLRRYATADRKVTLTYHPIYITAHKNLHI